MPVTNRAGGFLHVAATLFLVLWGGTMHALAAADAEAAEFPEPVRLSVEVMREPNKGYPIPYVPSQNLAAYPERIHGIYLSLGANGLGTLMPDVQEPTDGGVRYLPGAEGYYMLHHRRAGVRCLAKPVFRMRMELQDPLATMVLAVREGDNTVWLDDFDVNRFEVLPGRVVTAIELHSVATETFFGLAGLTLATVEQ